MAKSRFKQETRRWECIRDVMRDSTDAARLRDLPGRAWPQVKEVVIRSIREFQRKRLKAGSAE